MSSDGNFLYAGESGLTGDNLFKYAVSAAGSTVADRTTYNNRYGFETLKRHTYLSPGGQHIYYADFQLDAHALGFATGRTGELICAEDAAGSFAVGESHVFDATLVRPVAALPHGASAAALTADDRELWYYGGSGRLYYVNIVRASWAACITATWSHRRCRLLRGSVVIDFGAPGSSWRHHHHDRRALSMASNGWSIQASRIARPTEPSAEEA